VRIADKELKGVWRRNRIGKKIRRGLRGVYRSLCRDWEYRFPNFHFPYTPLEG